jgi:hypothetical protein
MHETTLDAWPLVRVRIAEPVEDADSTALFAALTAGLDGDQPFALVVTLDARRPRGRPRDALEQIRWIKGHRAVIASRCAGIAVRADGGLLATATKTLAASERFLGCPAKGFVDDVAAVAWARARLAGRGD